MRGPPALALAFAIVVPSAAVAATAAPDAERLYLSARDDLAALRADEKRRVLRHHWLNVARRLDRLSKDPRGSKACEATFTSARLYAELAQLSRIPEDRNEAVERYRRVASACPASSLADDALLASAELVRRSDPAGARADLEAVAKRFPKADMAAKARAMLAELGEKRAEKPAAKEPAAGSRPQATATPGADARDGAAPAPDLEPEAWSLKPEARSPKPDPPTATHRAPEPEDGSLAALLEALDGAGADGARPADVALAEDEAQDAALDRARLAKLAEISRQARGELSLSMLAGLKVKRVVIDPGHGGHDVGAVGPAGTKESEVALEISKKLAKRLRAMGLEVVLTRDGDEYLALEERTKLANDQRADLLISIHCNAARSRKLRGIETYTLNLSSDRYAMRLAARENAATGRTIGDLQLVLADLATKANTDDSVRLARVVQRELVSGLRSEFGAEVRDLGTKQALFFVLLGARMPAILVETSFVSNPAEEKRLASDRYQDEAADGIAAGVRKFIESREEIARAPGGSVF